MTKSILLNTVHRQECDQQQFAYSDLAYLNMHGLKQRKIYDDKDHQH